MQFNRKNEVFIKSISQGLNITRKEAIIEISDFFSDKTLLVQPYGFQKYFYKMGTFAQTAGCASMAARTIVMAKAYGASGLQLIQAQPFLVVALPTVGGIFFHGCGQVIGNNTVGRTFNTIGNVLNLPMTLVEMTYNSYLAPLVNRTIGIPTILNYTQQVRLGPGLTFSEAFQFIKSSEKASILKTVKCFILTKLGGKC